MNLELRVEKLEAELSQLRKLLQQNQETRQIQKVSLQKVESDMGTLKSAIGSLRLDSDIIKGDVAETRLLAIQIADKLEAR